MTEAADRKPPRPPFELREPIGEGASSTVWSAHDTTLHREIAVKVLRRRPNRESLRRFVAEARTTSLLDHPSVVPVHALGTDTEGRFWFSMKRVRGDTLEDLIRNATDWPSRAYFRRHVEVLIRVADALSFAHSKGVVHRDVKPANIMVGPFGQVYLMDWGIARRLGDHSPEPAVVDGIRIDNPVATADGSIAGTPAYMSPEQAHGQVSEVDERTDVFGLGATLWAVLARQAPWERPTVKESVDAARVGHVRDPRLLHPRAALPAALCRIALKAMAGPKDHRYPDIASLRDELAAFLSGGHRFVSKRFRAGTWVLRQGEPATEAYVVVEGQAEVLREDGTHVRALGPGDPFGEAAVLDASVRTASVRAVTDLVVEVIHKEDVDAWLAGDAWLAPLVRTQAARFRAMDAEFAAATQALTEARVQNALLRAVLVGDDAWPALRDRVAADLRVAPDVVETTAAAAGLAVRDGRLRPA